jgi:hypothetical protein
MYFILLLLTKFLRQVESQSPRFETPCIHNPLPCPYKFEDVDKVYELANQAIGELLPEGRLEETLSCLYRSLEELPDEASDHVAEVISANIDILCSSLVPMEQHHRRIIHNVNDSPVKWPPLTGPLPPPPRHDKAIFVTDDLLTEEQCSEIINLFENSALHEGNLLSGGKIIIDRKGKNRWEFDMSNSAEMFPDTWGVWDRLFVGKVVKMVMKYEEINPIVRTLKTPLADEGFRVIRYNANSTSPDPEQHMWHADGGQEARGTNPRLLASIIYLNSPLEGGETVFLNQGFSVTPKCGRGLLFPSAFPYVHGGRPVQRGSKYAVVLMINL